MSEFKDKYNLSQIDHALKIIVDASPMGIVVFDTDMRIVYANPPAEHIFGKSGISPTGLKCGDFIDCAKRHFDPEGCGHTQFCSICPLFLATDTALSDGPDSLLEGEVLLEREPELKNTWLKYKVRGVLLDSRNVAVMVIDDITDNKRNEKELRNALTELSVIHEYAPIAMILVDNDRRIRKANGFASKFAGRKEAEMIGLRGGEALRCLHHLDDPRGCGFGPACTECSLKMAVLETFETKEGINEVEAWLPFPDGESRMERCLLVSTAYLKIDYEERVLVCVQDITDRKSAEQSLVQSEKKYRELISSVNSIILKWDRNGKIEFLNEYGLNFFGYQQDEIIGKPVTGTIVPEVETGGRDLSRLMHDIFEKPSEYEKNQNENIKKDGSRAWIAWTNCPIYDDEGSASGMLSVGTDFTELKKAEEALLASEQRYRALFERNQNPIGIIDSEGWYMDANPAFLNFTEKTKEQLLKMNVFDFAPPTQKRKQEIDYKAVCQKGENIEIVYFVNGKEKILDLTITPIDYMGKKGILGAGKDVTERKKLQLQLTQSQKMEAVGRLAGGVAHDFNNMLGVILGHTEMALGGMTVEDPLYPDLTEIAKAARRSADLTRQLLGFARRQTIAPKVINLNETVEKMLRMLRRLIGEDIDLAWMPGKKLWPVNMDPSQLDQILANLCVNARDAIEGVGKVTIETGDVTLDENYCADRPGFHSGDYVMIAVSDDGIGMEREVLGNIFEPFFTTKEVGKGTGLGLSTVYGIVKQNDGYINVYSEPGEGTTFKIYIPRYMKKPTRSGEKVQDAPPVGGDETVLLVEDEPMLLQMGKAMLARFGYRVLAAGSPAEAVRLAGGYEGGIDLLITDVVMPTMNGKELAAEVQSLCPGIKTLFMSGYTANVIAHHGVLDKGVHFIQKPFSLKDLSLKVRQALKGDRAR